jgi:O-methyltransferase
MSSVSKFVRRALQRAGYALVRNNPVPQDLDTKTQELCRMVRPYTMTSPERIFALRQSVQYVVQHGILGDIVECGVWKGGSMMVVAQTLKESGRRDVNLHLFDTFEGMPEPTQFDMTLEGISAAELLAESKSAKEADGVWAYSALDEVKRNIQTIGYPEERISFIKGKVEDTIPKHAPARIALLRLDTDWYESVYHSLVHLYPLLSPGGILIIDDYGAWAGARKAVDQYFAEHNLHPLLHRIDGTGRICIKTH